MEQLFTTLTRAVEVTPALAVLASLTWGILSVLLSPCHLSSIPLIVGFIDKQGRMSTRRAFLISILFAVGILTTIAAMGAVTASAGRMIGDVGRYGNCFVAGIFFLVGLYLLDVLPMPWSGPGQVGMKRKGLLAAYGIGHCSVIVLAGPSTGLVQRYLNWSEKSQGTVIVKKICGVLVIPGGLYLIYAAR